MATAGAVVARALRGRRDVRAAGRGTGSERLTPVSVSYERQVHDVGPLMGGTREAQLELRHFNPVEQLPASCTVS